MKRSALPKEPWAKDTWDNAFFSRAEEWDSSEKRQPVRQPYQDKLRNAKGINGLMQQLVYEEVRLSMSKMSIVALIVGLMFLGALFFAIGFLSALTSLEAGGGNSKNSWQTLNMPSQQQEQDYDVPSKSSPGGGFGGFLNRYVGSKAQHQLSKQESRAALLVPKPLQPFARYGIADVNAQGRRTVNQENPFLNRNTTRMMAATPPPQPYGYPQPPQQGQIQEQPIMQPQYQQPMPYPEPAPVLQYQQPPYQQQGMQPQYQQPPQPMNPQYQQPLPIPQQQGYR